MKHYYFTILVGCAGFSGISVAAPEITAENLPKDFHDVRVATASDASYLQTGIPKRNMANGTISLLAVSPINPMPAPQNAVSEGYFAQNPYRPMTWREANQACSDYKKAGKAWTLPSLHELKQINYFAQFASRVLDETKAETAALRAHWKKQPQFLGQYHFFWTSEVDNKTPDGIKIAGTFGTEGRSQKMTAANLLSVVCITYFESPERESDRLAIPTPGKLPAEIRGVSKG